MADITHIPKTWALIDACFPRVITELVANYFINGRVESDIEQWSNECFRRNIENRERQHALRLAVEREDVEAIDALMDIGVDIIPDALDRIYDINKTDKRLYNLITWHRNFHSWDALLWVASLNGIVEHVHVAIHYGASNLDDCLFAACKSEHNHISNLIIDAGADYCLWHCENRDGRWEGCFARHLGVPNSDGDDGGD